jgi:NAD+ synthase
MALSWDVLALDYEAEANRIAGELRRIIAHECKRRGLVVALSGGIDSSCVAGLATRALGKAKVFGLHMPERDSSAETLRLSRSVSDTFGFDSVLEEITPILDGYGCYRRRDEAIRTVYPDFGPGWKSKIVLPGLAGGELNVYYLVVQRPDGSQDKQRLPLPAYLQIVAATNFKQRRARPSSTSTPTACTTRSAARPTASSTTRASS